MIEIKRNYDADDFTFEAKSEGELLAELHGEIAGDVFNVKSYSGDKFLFDGVSRAAMNNADHEGAVSAVFAQTIPDELMKLVVFGREIPDIAEFFDGKKEKST